MSEAKQCESPVWDVIRLGTGSEKGEPDMEDRTPENVMSLAEEVRRLRSEVKRPNNENKRPREAGFSERGSRFFAARRRKSAKRNE